MVKEMSLLFENQRTIFLRNTDEKLIRYICDCVFNALKNNTF